MVGKREWLTGKLGPLQWESAARQVAWFQVLAHWLPVNDGDAAT